MKKIIVITSIFQPTEAVLEFSKKKDYQLIVVGDNKTPSGWSCDDVLYMPVKTQENSAYSLAEILPYNHYCRKMLGYLEAIKNGAQFIIDTDDDNIPKKNWEFPKFELHADFIPESKGFVNIYQLYTDQKIWPRGLPLNLINTAFDLEKDLSYKHCKVGIWQGLADEDPDVDAIYRLTNDKACYFNKREPVVLGKGTLSPFNTQNTMIRSELFPLLYLPTYVTFRFTDILRGLITQPIMWLYGYHLGFTHATVIQKRNPHDYLKDFISEIPMYINSEKIIDLVENSISLSNSIEANMYNAYDALVKEDIVCDKEIIALEAWLNDLNNLRN